MLLTMAEKDFAQCVEYIEVFDCTISGSLFLRCIMSTSGFSGPLILSSLSLWSNWNEVYFDATLVLV